MTRENGNIIQRLPEELRLTIFSYCDSSILLNLSRTSRSMYHTCNPSLLHTIDLSIHNRPEWARERSYINVNVPADYCDKLLDEQDKCVQRQQQRLISLLIKQPHLATQTRMLTWTVFQRDDPVDWLEASSRDWDIWKVFECFNKVTKIDLALMSNWRETRAPPPSIFKSATSISIAGVASYAVLASIFTSINPSKLRYLRLNNLQTFVEPRDLLQTLSQENILSHRRDRAGAAYGWLSRLTGRCTSLRAFHFCTTAEFVDKSNDPHAPPTWNDEVRDEHRRYAELGAFVESIKPTVRELSFEHGPDIDYSHSNSPSRHTIAAFQGPNHDDPLPMDVYFDTHLLPVLVSGPWPCLRSIILRGIGHWKPIHPWSQGATLEELRYLQAKTSGFRDRSEMIWEAVGAGKSGVETVIEDEASRPFYRFQADKRRNMTGIANSGTN